MLLLAGLYALVVGAVVGLLGAGGSLLTLPLLVYLIGMEEKEGIAGSLFVVAVTSLIAAAAHARRGAVRWGPGLLFGGLGMAAAYLAGRAAAWIPGNYLVLGFGVVALAAALAMMRGRVGDAPRTAPNALLRIGAAAVAVGSVAGLVGAGGGFLIVPALTLLGGLSVVQAIGTSLLVIAMQSTAGFLGHAAHVRLDWPILGVVVSASVLGSLLGTRLGPRLSTAALRQSFAWLVLFVAAFIVVREAPTEVLPAPFARAGGAILFLAVVGMGIRSQRLGRQSRRPTDGGRDEEDEATRLESDVKVG